MSALEQTSRTYESAPAGEELPTLQLYAIDILNNLHFLFDWLTNRGDDDRTYGQNHRLTQLLMESNGMDHVKEEIVAAGCLSGGYNYGTIQGYLEGVLMGGYASNASEWQIGGFVVEATRTDRTIETGETIFEFQMVNEATWRSLLGLGVVRNWVNRLPFVNLPEVPDLRRDQIPISGRIIQRFEWEQGVCCEE